MRIKRIHSIKTAAASALEGITNQIAALESNPHLSGAELTSISLHFHENAEGATICGANCKLGLRIWAQGSDSQKLRPMI